MAAKKKSSKRSKKSARGKKTAKRKTKKTRAAASRRTSAKTKRTKKTAKRKTAKRAKPAKKRAAAPKREFGEGNYKATREFDKAQTDFVAKNRDRIPEMGREAADTLDGPEGVELEQAEQETLKHAHG